LQELGAVTPPAIGCIGKRNPLRVTRIPASSARRTFWVAVSSVKGGNGGLSIIFTPVMLRARRLL
jgi:hypothetical protein